MRVGIIADTHISSKSVKEFKNFLNKTLLDVELIIHAGDVTSEETLKVLKDFKPLIVVKGNNDKEKLERELEDKKIVVLDSYRIGVVHGHQGEKETLENAMMAFQDDELDVMIFGHSHKPFITTKGKTLIINPGSFTRRRKERWFSYVILDLNKDGIEVHMKTYNKWK